MRNCGSIQELELMLCSRQRSLYMGLHVTIDITESIIS